MDAHLNCIDKSYFQPTVNILTTLDLDDLNSFPTPRVWDTRGVMMTGLCVPGDTVWHSPAPCPCRVTLLCHSRAEPDHRVPGSRWENTLKMSATSRTFSTMVLNMLHENYSSMAYYSISFFFSRTISASWQLQTSAVFQLLPFSSLILRLQILDLLCIEFEDGRIKFVSNNCWSSQYRSEQSSEQLTAERPSHVLCSLRCSPLNTPVNNVINIKLRGLHYTKP